jgi:hypothetical protein
VLHIGDIVVSITKVIVGSTTGLYETFDAPELSGHHGDFLAQKVLFFLQSVVFPFELDDLVVFVSGIHWHALSCAIIAVLRWNT